MDPTFLIYGIQATLRAAQAGADLYSEHSRDRKVFLPDLELPEGPRITQLVCFFSEQNSDDRLNATYPEFARCCKNGKLTDDDGAVVDAAYAVMLRIKAKAELVKAGRKDDDDANREASMLAGGRMVEQWREERKPPSAMVRFALTLTDIGLEFVGANPSILGAGSRGEKLIAAFAVNLSTLIPDNVAAFGARANFADRLLGVFLRAGLGALTDNAAIAVHDKQVAVLISGVVKPIMEVLPNNIAEQMRYRDLVDTLAGPVAATVFGFLGDNTTTYLGKRFADDRALGAVTKALFTEIQAVAAGGNVLDVLGNDGAIRLYKAALGVAVSSPALFVAANETVKTELVRDLISGFGTILRDNPRFKGQLGSALASVVVEVVGANAPALLKLKPDQPWDKIAIQILQQVIGTLGGALATNGALQLFTDDQFLQFGRIILMQVAATPGMLGIDRSEVQSIASGLAAAMAADAKLLLSADQWIRISGVAVEQAALNPGRLFGINADNAQGALAVTVIQSILKVAAESWGNGDRQGRPLLFGTTLANTIETALRALAGNVQGIAQHPEQIEQFLLVLLAQVNARHFGSQSWEKVLPLLLIPVLATGQLPSDAQIQQALAA